jgi:hypothetical protein
MADTAEKAAAAAWRLNEKVRAPAWRGAAPAVQRRKAMLWSAEARVKYLGEIIELLRTTCRDAGIRLRDDPLLEPEAACDLCSSRPDRGRLLVGKYGVEVVVNDDGTVEVRPRPPENPRHAMYWVCLPCFRLLATPDALLRRLLEAHGCSPN